MTPNQVGGTSTGEGLPCETCGGNEIDVGIVGCTFCDWTGRQAAEPADKQVGISRSEMDPSDLHKLQNSDPSNEQGDGLRETVERAGIWANLPEGKSVGRMMALDAFEAGKRVATDAILSALQASSLRDTRDGGVVVPREAWDRFVGWSGQARGFAVIAGHDSSLRVVASFCDELIAAAAPLSPEQGGR